LLLLLLFLLRWTLEAQELERRRPPASHERLFERLQLALQLGFRLVVLVPTVRGRRLRDGLVDCLELLVCAWRDVRLQRLVDELDLERRLAMWSSISVHSINDNALNVIYIYLSHLEHTAHSKALDLSKALESLLGELVDESRQGPAHEWFGDRADLGMDQDE
jgi:hypothetical protein